MSVPRAQADEMLGRYVATALRVGMYASLVLLALGVLSYLALDGEAGKVLMPWEALLSALRGEALGLMSLGIICLIATPLLGVLAALLTFLRAKDRRFAAVALCVLGVVLLAIIVKVLA